MKQLILIAITFLTLQNFVLAQKYVKFQNDITDNKSQIKLFKGEIYQVIKENKGDLKYSINAANNTILVGRSVKDTIFPLKNYIEIKDSLIKKDVSGNININVASINANDTIKFVSEKSKITPLFEKRIVTLLKDDVGNFFRLIIPNTPTIWYKYDSLHVFVADTTKIILDSDNDGVPDYEDNCVYEAGIKENNGCPIQNHRWVIWLTAFFVAIILLFASLKYNLLSKILPKKKIVNQTDSLDEKASKQNNNSKDQMNLEANTIERTEKYFIFSEQNKGKPFEVFLESLKNVENKLNLSDFLNINKIEGYYNAAKSEKKEIAKKFNGKNLIVGYLNETITKEDQETKQVAPESSKETLNSERTEENTTHSINIDLNSISMLINQSENKIIEEIQKYSYKPDNISKEIKTLKDDNFKLNNDKKIIDARLLEIERINATLLNEKSNIEERLKDTMQGKQQVEKIIMELQNRLYPVDFIKTYASDVLVFFQVCRQISEAAFEILKKMKLNNSQNINTLRLLLEKYQFEVLPLPIGNWEQSLLDIKNSGTTTNSEIIRAIAQSVGDDTKTVEFQKFLFSQVLVKYCNAILILAEELQNLEQFGINNETANNTKVEMIRMTDSLLSKANVIYLEARYVKLFSEFKLYYGQIEASNSEKSEAYINLQGESGLIIEIVRFGFRTPFGDTKTQVIFNHE